MKRLYIGSPRRLHILIFCLLLVVGAGAKVTLPALFTDGMVLQRGRLIPVWGWADPGENITVKLGKKSVTAVADAAGCWRADLPKMKAGGPYELHVADLTVSDVMVGDVWLCSGQSNIDTDIERVYPQYPAEIDADDLPMVRLFRVENVVETREPLRDVRTTGWKRLNKQNGWNFSALGYFLGKRMHRETGVAQGVIQSSWGGTPIEAWLPRDSMMTYNPTVVYETQFFQDDKLVSDISGLNNRLNNRWHALLNEKDPGISGRWTDPQFDDSSWQEASQYRLPVSGWKFCGSYWLRQHIHVDAAHAGKPALLRLGMLYDADYTFVNGQEVGRTYYQYPPRRYQIPEGLLREGDNVITVRFVNKSGRPSFAKDKPYRIEFSDTDTLAVGETWRVHDGIQLPSQPSISLGTQNLASVLWNGMLRPLAPYAMSGVVWYQGETNTARPLEYYPLLCCLMHSWREIWQRPDLPFAIVQLANYMAPSARPQNSGWAQLREAQRTAARDDERAGLAVAIDLGEAVDIHPLKKKEVAGRCALVFDRLVFGRNDVRLSPEPLLARLNTDGTVVITFDQPLRDGTVKGFETAGADGKFRNAEATAKGSTVTLNSQSSTVTTVRYAWKDNPAEADGRAKDSAGKENDGAGCLPIVPFQIAVQANP